MHDYVRNTQLQDVMYISKNMRAEDITEVRALGFEPRDILTHGYLTSTVCLTLVEPGGNPGAMLGVVPSPLGDEFGLIWLLGTPYIEKNPIAFLRYSKPVLQTLYEKTGCSAFYNYTHIDNALHHKWLKWLGFAFINVTKAGPNNDSFYEFVRLRGN